MSRHSLPNTTRLFSLAETFGEIQLVASAGRLLIDVQSRNYDATGYLRREHALANLPLNLAKRFQHLLNEAIRAAEVAPPPQPPSWSESAYRRAA